jgi:hypothetical protein
MFWKRSSHQSAEDVREFVRDRLRLAFDFATLGAYELSEHEPPEDGGDARRAADASSESGSLPKPAPAPKCREARGARRVPRAHAKIATGATGTCVELEPPRCSALEGMNRAGLGRDMTRQAGRRRSRGGDVVPPRQPCLWVGR